MMPLLKSRVFILLALLVTFAGTAVAGDITNNDPFSPVNNLIFDLSPTNGVTSRGAGDGPGQGVIVYQDTNITQMAMFLNMPNGGDIKYMIWDMNNGELAYSQTLAVGASDTMEWVLSNPFSFDLHAGTEYWFGVIADNNIDVGYIYPTINYSNNGLVADSSGNSNYTNYNDPQFNGYAASEIGLRLYSGGESTVPEPGTLLMLGSGIVASIGAARRKFRP